MEAVETACAYVLGFGQAEDAVHGAKRRGGPPKQTGFRAPVPGRGAEHAGHDDTADDVHDLICNTGQRDGLLPETRRRDLADDRVADGT